MIYGKQIRAARALLGWDQEALSKAAGLGVATVRRLEAQEGAVNSHTATLRRLIEVFAAEGVTLLANGTEGGPGARLTRPY